MTRKALYIILKVLNGSDLGGYKNILLSMLTILLASRAIYSCIPLKTFQYYIIINDERLLANDLDGAVLKPLIIIFRPYPHKIDIRDDIQGFASTLNNIYCGRRNRGGGRGAIVLQYFAYKSVYSNKSK